jgi:broad specificity phosphatase PhoE
MLVQTPRPDRPSLGDARPLAPHRSHTRGEAFPSRFESWDLAVKRSWLSWDPWPLRNQADGNRGPPAELCKTAEGQSSSRPTDDLGRVGSGSATGNKVPLADTRPALRFVGWHHATNPADIEVVGVACSLRRLATGGRERHAVLWARHGQNEANLSRQFSYLRLDLDLTTVGRAQAERLAGALAERLRELPRPPALFASPLRRAQQTAAIVAKQMRGDVGILDELREVNVGDLDGRSDPEAWKIYESVLNDWRRGDHDRRFSGGENWQELCARIAAALSHIASKLVAAGSRGGPRREPASCPVRSRRWRGPRSRPRHGAVRRSRGRRRDSRGSQRPLTGVANKRRSLSDTPLPGEGSADSGGHRDSRSSMSSIGLLNAGRL